MAQRAWIARKRSERGVTLVVFTIVTAFIMLPMAGLAIDVSIQYWIKAKLSSAVDAASLAAARSLSVGLTTAAQQSSAISVGQQYFAANFPSGILGATLVAGSPNITLASTSLHVRTVTTVAQVSAPLYFLRLLHVQSGVITASGQATRKDANIILVLDRSGSMNNSSNSCSALVSSVQFFTTQFVDGRDQIGLVTYSTSANVDYNPKLYFKSGSPTINSVINTLVCAGATSTAQALTLAYKEIKTVNEPGALNVILFFTDGGANSVVATYPIKRLADMRYDYANYTTLTSTPASSCSAALTSLYGLYTDFSASLNPTGPTGGVLNVTPLAINQGSSTPPVVAAPGCSFTQPGAYGTWGAPEGRADVAYIPLLDSFGNATTGYKPVDLFPSGYVYAGQIRPDTPIGIRYAAMNAADSIAQKIRADTTSNIVTYSIGLSGNEPIPMDTDFLERIANDERASNYNPGQPQGTFMLATDNASLADAFNAIASQILRLSK
jgi:Flp pilus assembly protein TadG